MSGLDEQRRRLTGFGAVVRAERQRLGWAQRDLAYAADTEQSYVCRVENGRVSGGLLLHRLADGLGVPLDVLLAEARRAEEEG